jgi:hypothetical protein
MEKWVETGARWDKSELEFMKMKGKKSGDLLRT